MLYAKRLHLLTSVVEAVHNRFKWQDVVWKLPYPWGIVIRGETGQRCAPATIRAADLPMVSMNVVCFESFVTKAR